MDSVDAQAYAGTQAQIIAGETALYVDQSSSSCSNSGPGSQVVPFCSIQAAANVVDPGQTVYIETSSGTQAQDYDENVTITRSGTPSAPITFARLDTEPIPDVDPYTNGGVPITLRNVHDVRLYFLALDHRNGQNGIVVTGSSDITLVGTCYADRGAFELQDSLNPAPSAITPASLQGPVPFSLSVTLSAPATSGWGEPVSYTIDFGDGSEPVQVAPASTTSHTYTISGQYTLTITAADTGGSTVTYQRQVTADT